MWQIGVEEGERESKGLQEPGGPSPHTELTLEFRVAPRRLRSERLVVVGVMTASVSDQRGGGSGSSLCPYCGSEMTGRDVCPSCGVFCYRCGTPYRGSYCTNCYGGEEVSYIAPGTNPQGEVAPARYDGIVRPKLEGGGSVSKREANFLDSTFLREGAKETHDKAERAVRFLRLSDEAKGILTEQVETMASKLMKSSGGTINREKAVLHALYVGAKAMGIPATEVQECLARSGFSMRIDSLRVTVECENPSSVQVFVNDEPRSVRAAVVGGRDGQRMLALSSRASTVCSVRVPLYLSDALNSDGGERKDGVLLRFRNASVVSYHPRYNNKLRPVMLDASTLKLGLDPRKCFTYFKLLKDVALGDDDSCPSPSSSRSPVTASQGTAVNPGPFIKRFLSTKKYPISFMLAEAAGCAQRLKSLTLDEFKERIRDANGRSPETVAVECLYIADRRIFSSPLLTPEARALVRMLALKVARSTGDMSYTGVEGVLVPSELGRSPPTTIATTANDRDHDRGGK